MSKDFDQELRSTIVFPIEDADDEGCKEPGRGSSNDVAEIVNSNKYPGEANQSRSKQEGSGPFVRTIENEGRGDRERGRCMI